MRGAGDLTCVVVDELHMVGAEGRGLALETTLTKLLFHPDAQGVQIVGMSATVGGLQTLADWLRARLFLTNFRPVPLKEHAVFGGTIFELVGTIQGPMQASVMPCWVALVAPWTG